MSDLRLEIFEDGADFALEDGDLALGDGLVEAVVVALFSDARTGADDQALRDPNEPGGWCLEEPGDRFGSRLWLLANGTVSDSTAAQVRDVCTEALTWLRELDIAQSYEVEAQVAATGDRIEIEVRIRRGTARGWSELWTSLAAGDAQQISVGGAQIRLLYT